MCFLVLDFSSLPLENPDTGTCICFLIILQGINIMHSFFISAGTDYLVSCFLTKIPFEEMCTWDFPPDFSRCSDLPVGWAPVPALTTGLCPGALTPASSSFPPLGMVLPWSHWNRSLSSHTPVERRDTMSENQACVCGVKNSPSYRRQIAEPWLINCNYLRLSS